MLLSEILKKSNLEYSSTNEINYQNIDVIDITRDTRQVKKGSLFIAVIGVKVDGHDLINEAIEKGASVIIHSKDIKDIKDNPVVESVLLAPIKAIPVLGDLIDSSTNKLLNDFQQKKEQELLDVILQDDHSITSEMVNDVEFIINFARAKEAVQRLATTDKVEYFGNLIRNGYLQGKHIDGSIFDEYIHILNTMSYREIQYLVEYKKYCEDSSKRGKSTKHINGRTYSNKYESFCNEYSKQIKVSPGEVDYVFLHIKQTGFIEEEFETESGDVDENDNTFDSLDVESKGYYITKEFLDFYEMVLKRNENNG